MLALMFGLSMKQNHNIELIPGFLPMVATQYLWCPSPTIPPQWERSRDRILAADIDIPTTTG
jgi:hypothetical protein